MDIELARTFLEIVHCGSFQTAAERLHVTQTAVTARVQNMESQLGCRLFVRNRSGARLTEHGERFIIHASQLVQTWDAARRELPLPEEANEVVNIGSEVSLWYPLLQEWITRLRAQYRMLVVNAEVSDRYVLREKLEHGTLDAALVHQPEYWPGIQVEQLLEEKLVMVRTTQEEGDYLFMDWGEGFRRQHDAALPEQKRSNLTINHAPLALRYLLENGGSGYFRTRAVQPYLQDGRLQRVAEAPEFSFPVYLVYPRGKTEGTLLKTLDTLRSIVEGSGDQWLPRQLSSQMESS